MNADARTSGDELRLARLLLPELAERLDTVVGATDAARAEREFDDWLDAESDRLGERFSTAAFAELDAEASARFSAAFRRARALAERVGIEAPEPEALIEAGLDPAALADAIAEDPTLEAVLAPYGLGDLAWRELFRSAGASGAAGGLVLATEVVREFGRLDAVPDPSTPRVAVAGTDGGRIEWTLRAIPAGERPSVLGLGYAHGPHVSLPEMLALQLGRLVAGADPVDTQTFTWLAGTLADGGLAARHVFDRSDDVVRIAAREIGNQGPHLGARPPIG
ncbi:hypothetical protein BMH32_05180 [Leucobacter sp. OLJS4]|uniref:hypothetical protein n=1 Tax=unclassified Leucobacter TaxID=2621730 RepID=UPI000C1788C3|nr:MULTISPECIES: hypothetical protein [unclassified Leucobacter]PII81853.1 hypothetical protein BMH25_13905 [Leucobacter sp. OLCALW19]PII86525.1 hypothetical protein BMH26_14335 [Leucobacter sp. OLTLW20]PII90462.1 hypothetical protein BMH27_12500 [Leucobacter sp. OLAS13]PII97493.1 hypothetical protein BMH29_13185 [Leucobacter sp. OLDS2]PIJ01545.1 hypothetical protein BMH28_06580 [Leucobacter sp. OLCS4]